MIFKRGFWLAAALGAVVLNVAGGIYAYSNSEPVHAFIHGAIAFAFSLLALTLRSRAGRAARELPAADRTPMLEADLAALERELRETRERLEFADQLLKNRPPQP